MNVTKVAKSERACELKVKSWHHLGMFKAWDEYSLWSFDGQEFSLPVHIWVFICISFCRVSDTVILFVGSGKWPWKFWNGSLNKLYGICCCHVKIAHRLEQCYHQTQQCSWEFVPALSVSSHRFNKHQCAHTSHNTALIDRWCDIPLLLLSSPKEKWSVIYILHTLIYFFNSLFLKFIFHRHEQSPP